MLLPHASRKGAVAGGSRCSQWLRHRTYNLSQRSLATLRLAAERLLPLGNNNIGVVRRRTDHHRTKTLAAKIRVEKSCDVVSPRRNGFLRAHATSLDKALRQPYCIGRRHVLGA